MSNAFDWEEPTPAQRRAVATMERGKKLAGWAWRAPVIGFGVNLPLQVFSDDRLVQTGGAVFMMAMILIGLVAGVWGAVIGIKYGQKKSLIPCAVGITFGLLLIVMLVVLFNALQKVRQQQAIMADVGSPPAWIPAEHLPHEDHYTHEGDYHVDRERGFALFVPDGWDLVTSGQIPGIDAAAISPVQNAKDRFRELITVTTDGVPMSWDSETFMKEVMPDIASQLTEYEQRKTGRKRFSKVDQRLYWTSYMHLADDGGEPMRIYSHSYFHVNNGWGYVITRSTHEGSLGYMLNTKRMLESFFVLP